MTEATDSQLGQLLLARGHLKLGELLEAVSACSQTGEPLDAYLTRSDLVAVDTVDELREYARSARSKDVEEQLARGETLVVESIFHTTSGGTFQGQPPTTEQEKGTGPLPPADLSLTEDSRYAVQDELGKGGMGLVLLARDNVLRREIALKTLLPTLQNDESAQQRLSLEAQVTGHLEHPSIVPIYDLGTLGDGDPYYTMRVAREESLEQIIGRMRRGEDSGYSLTQLISILRQVALAIQYAHDQGVIHRDLKPENLLVGSYGEVFVIDWGVAKVVNADIGEFSMVEEGSSEDGKLVGTPHYMSPEQAQGLNEALDGRSDVYSLGAILYELLTLQTVHDAPSVLSLLFKVAQEPLEPPAERAPDREIPAELEEICIRALSKDPDERYPSSEAFADDLELFLEGVKERERRLALAQKATREGEDARERYFEMREEYIDRLRELNRVKLSTPSWAEKSAKERVWKLEEQAENSKVELERRFGESTRLFGQALGHIPDYEPARRALAGLYWQRFEEAEAAGDRARATYFESLVRQNNDGSYDALLQGNAFLEIETSISGFEVVVHRFVEKSRRLVPQRVTELGRTPIARTMLPHGSYVLELRREGYAPLRVPVSLGRFEERKVTVKAYEASAVPQDFIVISGGEFLSGEVQPLDLESNLAHIGDFAIQRHPVTFSEYLEFLNHLNQSAPQAAAEHAPRIEERASYFPRDEQGYFRMPDEDAEGDQPGLDWPIAMVSFFDAEAYARWRSGRDEQPFRLPDELEWEKAARGVDGRLYPWGDHFDASFCKMKESTRVKPVPAPVGAFQVDRSPYGAADMAGNVIEWTRTKSGDGDKRRVIQGASFNSIAMMCRLDWNMDADPDNHLPYIGFRLAMDLDSR
ncbi:MAG: SUMF1/EgtB/PvdO family nonheme iron enzyme [Myxococcota bacterium]